WSLRDQMWSASFLVDEPADHDLASHTDASERGGVGCRTIARPPANVRTKRKSTRQQRLVVMASLAAVLIACAGCQTFCLSKEEWDAQRRGEMADPEAGAAVGVAGTAAYYGLIVGEIVAAATRK